jgi:hypothetical protein
MGVTKLAEVRAQKVVDVLEALLDRAHAGELISLAFLAEQTDGDPISGLVGRYRAEPERALGELSVMKTRLAGYVASQRDDLFPRRP